MGSEFVARTPNCNHYTSGQRSWSYASNLQFGGNLLGKHSRKKWCTGDGAAISGLPVTFVMWQTFVILPWSLVSKSASALRPILTAENYPGLNGRSGKLSHC